jgi:preprotein translocase subunit SecD
MQILLAVGIVAGLFAIAIAFSASALFGLVLYRIKVTRSPNSALITNNIFMQLKILNHRRNMTRTQ